MRAANKSWYWLCLIGACHVGFELLVETTPAKPD